MVDTRPSAVKRCEIDASFNITGSTGQQSAQAFFSHDSTNGCFRRTITVAARLLTSITDGKACDDQE
jgi:hypothetical protein